MIWFQIYIVIDHIACDSKSNLYAGVYTHIYPNICIYIHIH